MTDSVNTQNDIYEYLFRSSADGILIAHDGKITEINPACAAMLQTPLETIVGKTPRQIFGRNTALVNLFEREGEQQLDVRLPRRRLAQGVANTLANGNRIVILQDVTEKRDIENRRDMLSKTIAHDLRNPISAISGFADLVGRFGDLNDQQQKYLLRARQTSTKLHEMIVLLVDLAWIEAGMPLQHKPLQIDDIVRRAIDTVRSQAAKHQIGIATSIQTPLPTIMGDPDRLHLAIYHLLQNAVLYTVPAQDTLSQKNIAVHAWGDEHEVYCSVADQGIGIDDSELELVFDRMYRSKDERIADIPGGGVGLTFSRTIFKRHGGDIWASSNLNEGSSFTFVLPAGQI